MPPFELHFTDAWLTFLFGVAALGYGFMFSKINDFLKELSNIKIDVAVIKTILRIETDKHNIIPERFRHISGQ